MNSEYILCFGSNFSGQLGIGDKTREIPSFCPYPFGCLKEKSIDVKDIHDIQCGSQFTVLLTTSGQVLLNIKLLFFPNFLLNIFFFIILIVVYLWYSKWHDDAFIDTDPNILSITLYTNIMR